MSSAATTDHPVTLRLLGPPALKPGPGEHPFAAERPYLLLGLLASRADWLRRDELADLLYPGRDLESARSNLRKVLFLARKLPGVGTIEQRGDLLRWCPPSDLAAFEAACDARRWAEAIDAYGGPLLLGLDAACPPTAAEWLDGERQRLQARWHEACTRRLAELADDPQATVALAQAMLRDDPFDDVAQHALGRAQKALGQAEQALRSLADFGERLSRETGLAPTAALQSLSVELRSSAPPPAPAPAPGLVGRRHERTLVQQRLDDPACRVLTLLGPPGVGKSALLRALRAELQGTWVALDDLAQADAVPGRVAAALGLVLDAATPPWAALASALAPREALLLLDNTEQLVLAAGLQSVLDAAPGLRIVAASRAPLGVAGEWRLPVEGLPLPDLDETDPEVLQANDAVRLFVERARPLAPAFDLAAEAAALVRLLHDVEGLPLAIELLAAWRRLMPVADIVAELAGSLDVLEPSQPHERSVRASFARSWQQLGPVEQRVLAQLALLPGPVDRELVRRVVQGPLPVLASLADRSLLRAEGDGRFALHPLIRRCAAPLAEDGEGVRDRHARYVAHLFGRRRDVDAAQLPHLAAAWEHALALGDAALVGLLHGPYAALLAQRAMTREGVQAMRAAADALRPQAARADAAAPALGRALISLALFHYQAGALDDALTVAAEALELARRLHDAPLEAAAMTRTGAVCWQRGDYAGARAAFARTMVLAGQLEDATMQRVRAASWMALVDKADGRYDDALAAYQEAVALIRREGQLPTHLHLLNNQGNLLRVVGRTAEALAVLEEGLALARAGAYRRDEPFLLTNLALVHETAGDVAAAHAWATRALASAAEHGEPMIEAAARLARSRTAAALRRPLSESMADLLDALSIAGRLRSPPLRVQCIASAGPVLAWHGRGDVGVALVRWAKAQPELVLSEREDADRRLAQAPPHAGPVPELAPDTPFETVLSMLHLAGSA